MGTAPADSCADQRLPVLAASASSDLQTVVSAAGTYLYVSAVGVGSFGWTPVDLVGRPQASFTHPDDAALVVGVHRDLLTDGTGSATTIQRFRCKDGSFRWTESRARVADAAGERVVVSSVRDISERRSVELDLQRQAATDPLTGIANRTVFMDRLRQALRRLDRHRGVVAVLFLDLDRFKLINDSVGHHVGDAVLAQMAERLLRVIRPQDTLARLGGDEFAVVAEDISTAEEAVALGARIVDAGRIPFQIGDEQFVCTTSAGIAVTPDTGHSAEDLLRAADLALYRAKDRGRDRAELFDEDLRTRAVGRLGTERMLRRAIEEDRLRVSYQPIVDLGTGNTVAVEALVRVWDCDQGELIAAGSFVEVAEAAGLLPTIDDWVFREVMDQAMRWRHELAASAFGGIAVNVTARHIADVGFAQSVIDDLAVRGLPAAALQIEVTERVLMEASNSAMSGLETLREAGVKVGLDDFGTGYSSLSYLRTFPLDVVKIDQSLVQDLISGGAGFAIVASIIDLSHALGMVVVAEGVETQAQLDHLIAMRCDRAQGFHFAPAGTAALIEQRLLNMQPEHGNGRVGDAEARPNRMSA